MVKLTDMSNCTESLNLKLLKFCGFMGENKDGYPKKKSDEIWLLFMQ